jgi:hypothetical protein
VGSSTINVINSPQFIAYKLLIIFALIVVSASMLLNVAVAVLISGRYATYVGVDAGEGLGPVARPGGFGV